MHTIITIFIKFTIVVAPATNPAKIREVFVSSNLCNSSLIEVIGFKNKE